MTDQPPKADYVGNLPQSLVVGSMCHCDDPDECYDHWEFFTDAEMGMDGEHVRRGHHLSVDQMRAIAALVAKGAIDVFPPFLFVSTGKSGVYIATRYRTLHQDPNDPRPPGIEVLEKIDVTVPFETIAKNLGWTPPAHIGSCQSGGDQ